MVRTLQLAAVAAFIRVCGDKEIMSATLIAAGFGDFVLRDGHVTTSAFWQGARPKFTVSAKARGSGRQ